MKEIVWVFGNSAAGKETFIRYIVDNPNSEIVKELGWVGKRISICQESIEFIGESWSSTLAEKRVVIPDRVKELLKSADVVLVKWQLVDSKFNSLKKLVQSFPKYKHRIIFLKVSRAESLYRLESKKWWTKVDNKNEFIDNENNNIQEQLNKLSQFEITYINATNKNTYNIIE